nr:hypothetical protein [Tanacetum cinerariifolium]
MNYKMKDSECVTHMVKIAPHNYSKENFLARFTPQKQLTPEQIFWSQDLIKMKSKALREQTTVSRPIKTLTVAVDSQITQLTQKVNVLQVQNDSFRAENDKIKQHYKELYDSIKITRAKHIEHVTVLTTKNVNLKAQILNTINSSKDHVKPIILTLGKYAIDVEPIPSRLRNNREAHLDYLRHLKESVKTIHEIVEEAKVIRPLDSSIVSACRYTKHSQELLEYAIGTCSNTHKHVAKLNTQKTNIHVPPSIGVNRCTDASESQPRSNTKKNRISPAKGVNRIEDLGKLQPTADIGIFDDEPMGLKGNASWDKGHRHIGVFGRGVGTVPV